jgi:peptidoglycan L-alanyl-D-glutamate endopeptidase CwlK
MIDLTSPTARNVDASILHPVFRDALAGLVSDLAKADIPLFVFEGVRTPVRQTYLYAQGRTRPGKIVTYAKAWHSYHQYGLAVDMVFGGAGKWSWDEPKKGMWKKYHELAKKHDLMPLDFETPHVQLSGTSSNALSEGRFPGGGDENWAEALASMVAAWTGSPTSPPPPAIFEKAPVT